MAMITLSIGWCSELTELKEKLAAARILLQSQQQAIERRDQTVQVSLIRVVKMPMRVWQRMGQMPLTFMKQHATQLTTTSALRAVMQVLFCRLSARLIHVL